MKKIILLTLLSIIGIICVDAKNDKKENINVVFSEKVYDFGTVSEKSDPVVREFLMTNNGSMPVAILTVSTSCGCTRSKFPKKPISPGETVKIKITFIPDGQAGEINKDIKLKLKSANGKNGREILRLEGFVIPENE